MTTDELALPVVNDDAPLCSCSNVSNDNVEHSTDAPDKKGELH